MTEVDAGPAFDRARQGSRHRVRIRTMLSLIAGRSSFRTAQLASNVALLPLWGATRYGAFAGALATFTWVIPLLQAGPEKTVLKLLPRAPRTGPQITELIVALLWLLPAPLLAAFAVAAVVDLNGPATLYLGVATMAVGSGSTLLLAGLHRVAGRPHYDFRVAFTLAAFQVLLIGVVVVADLGPLGYVACIVLAQTIANAVLLVRLGRPSMRIRRRPAFLRRIGWTVLLMGIPEILLYLCTSVLFAMMAASSYSAQVGPLFAVILVWSAVVTFVLYGLRIFAPQVSLRLHGRAGAIGRARAARIGRLVIAIDVVWAGLFVAVLATTGLLDAGRRGDHLLLWAALLASRIPAVVMLLLAGFLVENSDARATRITGLAAVAAFVTTAAVGGVLVFAYGALGLVATGLVAEVVQALMILLQLQRRTVASVMEVGVAA